MKDGVMLQFIPLLQHYFYQEKKSISLKMLVIIMFHLPIAQLIKKSERQEIVIVILTKILLGEAILVLPNITL